MKPLFTLFIATILVLSCQKPKEMSSTNRNNWEKRTVKSAIVDTVSKGSTFLSIYSQIYVRTEKEQSNLTATVSLHNPNLEERIFIDKAVYYNTHGEPIRTYFDRTIFIEPMETVQIIIDGIDKEGGTGANFVFDWSIKPESNEPIFEAVMISTYGNQGISFVTTGKKITR